MQYIFQPDRWVIERIFEPLTWFVESRIGVHNFELARYVLVAYPTAHMTYVLQQDKVSSYLMLHTAIVLIVVVFNYSLSILWQKMTRELHANPLKHHRGDIILRYLILIGVGFSSVLFGSWLFTVSLVALSTHLYLAACDQRPPRYMQDKKIRLAYSR